MKLRTGLPVMRRADDEVQVGTDPRWAVRLTGLTPGEVHKLLARNLAAGGPRLTRLAAELALAGLAVPDDEPDARTADDPAWGLLRPDDDPTTRRRRRSNACIGITGLGPTGVGIAVGLAAAGVGSVLADDDRPVRPADIGATGYRWSDVGRPRAEATRRAMRDVFPTAGNTGKTVPDMLVVVEGGAADPALGERLVALETTHLSVVVREADTVVGPLVVPGNGPCLRCLDLHRADLDPAWSLLLSQLVGAEPTEPGPVAGVAAGLAVATVLGVIDGLPPLVGRTWEVGLPDAVPRERTWAPHRRCGCTGLPDEP
ncbi:MAG: ThiF family adenylyltransferase [Micrococcales bacterium]|nr:ThiF family adenylyltransferase [Micrococcales bacterium]